MHAKQFFLLSAAGLSLTLASSAANDAGRLRDLGKGYETLSEWEFSPDGSDWEKVTVPHSYNAIDGHSDHYYRGSAFYRKTLQLSKKEAGRPLFLIFEGAAQAAEVTVNGKTAASHKGGYTPFTVDIHQFIQKGENEIAVQCDNREDPNLAPVSSDFNKNGGLHNPVLLLKTEPVYISPIENGLYRLHVSAPEVTDRHANVHVKTLLKNSGAKDKRVRVVSVLRDADGKTVHRKTVRIKLAKGQSEEFTDAFTVENPHLWNGTADPYLYTARITVKGAFGRTIDEACTETGLRYFSLSEDHGFSLNGRPYPLRGTSVHQDMDGKATALSDEDYLRDYEIIKELGCNFLRLAHYPHNDLAFRLCDRMGLIVQTEIPWVNICGVNARPEYFENLHQQMNEMITHLYNHPSIVFWGMWNELDSWGNHDGFQGRLDEARVVEETGKLYDEAKRLDPYRYVGLTDCSLLQRAGYESLKADYISENRYNGWYYSDFANFSPEERELHDKGFTLNVSEYGAGINPFCHTWKQEDISNQDNAKHFEEWGNLLHESHYQQIMEMPFLNFTSLWILFDFPVSGRQEGYKDSDDGVNYTDNDARKYMNDKGLVTRDRKLKKDVFYLYKSLWNHEAETVYLTGRRLHYLPAGHPYTVKVYSNARSLTLYHNGKEVQKLNSSGESTGVIWQFAPLTLQSAEDTFRVVSDSGLQDEIRLKAL